ncbi:MAG: hypothetical protein ACFE8G_09135 [Candidatus Hermodarchaeota archaeon]
MNYDKVGVDINGLHTSSFSNVYSDEFDSVTLDSKWSWINESSNYWSLSDNPGHLRLNTLYGEMSFGYTSYQNLLVQNAPSGDYEVILYISNIHNPYSSIPSFWGFRFRLLILQDHDNYVGIDFRDNYTATGLTTWFYSEIDDVTDIHVGQDYQDISYGYLKIKKEGNNYSGSFSSNGITWTAHTTIATINLNNPKIGILFGNGIGTPSSGHTDIYADIDYLHVDTSDNNGEQPIPGYNLYALIGILSIVAIIITSKIKKSGRC